LEHVAARAHHRHTLQITQTAITKGYAMNAATTKPHRVIVEGDYHALIRYLRPLVPMARSERLDVAHRQRLEDQDMLRLRYSEMIPLGPTLAKYVAALIPGARLAIVIDEPTESGARSVAGAGFKVTEEPKFPPDGWAIHPTNPLYAYKGREVITLEALRERVAPAPVADASSDGVDAEPANE
jgi:hypothetical protein